MEPMKIGIIGLGLIGGSLAKAIKECTPHQVLGFDTDPVVVNRALLLEAVDGTLSREDLRECDLVIVSLYPQTAIEVIRESAPFFGKGTIVMDTCGVKGTLCRAVAPLAEKYGFCFIGGHPMAGTVYSGFSHAEKSLFRNASMVLTPLRGTEIGRVDRVKRLCVSIGFTNTQIASPEEHDRVIAFTSQLAHIVSNAYVKSPSATLHQGFSAGSYRDLTRVARLNEVMWSELFLSNREPLIREIDGLIHHLTQYKAALEHQDAEALKKLLKEGSDRKLRIDGREPDVF